MSQYERRYFAPDHEDGSWTPTLVLRLGLHDFPGTKGVCVGYCIEGKDWNDKSIQGRFGALAHAHQHGKYKGWVCFGDPRDAWLRRGEELNSYFIHEVAHLLEPLDNHGRRWARRAKSLGVPDEQIAWSQRS